MAEELLEGMFRLRIFRKRIPRDSLGLDLRYFCDFKGDFANDDFIEVYKFKPTNKSDMKKVYDLYSNSVLSDGSVSWGIVRQIREIFRSKIE